MSYYKKKRNIDWFTPEEKAMLKATVETSMLSSSLSDEEREKFMQERENFYLKQYSEEEQERGD